MKNLAYRKPILFFAIAFLISIGFSSCNKYLDVKPKALRTTGNFFSNKENAIEAVNSIYNILASQNRWENGFLESSRFYIGEMLADDAAMGSVQGDYDDLERLIEWRPYTDNIILHGIWSRAYKGIYRSDWVLSNLPNSPIDSILKTRLEGEAYFLKGMNILRLVKVFGDIPITNGVVQPDQYGKVPQKTMHEGFEIAAQQFREAAKRLPRKSQYASADLGRATKGAAESMLARLYMLEAGMDQKADAHCWDSVYMYTNLVINSGEYGLVTNYATIHEPEGENDFESIFELQYGNSSSLNIGLGSNASNVGNTTQIRCSIRSASNDGLPGGWGYFQPTQLLVNAFEPEDPRLSCDVYGPNFNNGIVYGIKRNYNLAAMETEYYNRQLAISPSEAPALMVSPSNSSRNQIIIRYANVLLMNAEAAYHLGEAGIAQQDVNLVRARARNSTYCKGYKLGTDTYTPTGFSGNLPPVTATGPDLLKAIWHERNVELALQSMRYWDLVRTGRYFARLEVKEKTLQRPTGTSPEFANVDIVANCKARSIMGPRGIKDIPIFPIPGAEATKWNLHQLIGLYN